MRFATCHWRLEELEMSLGSVDRRAFLKLLGLGATSLGIPLVGGRRAMASPDCPLRIVFWYDTGGLIKSPGYPQGSGGAPWPEENNWDLGTRWQGFERYKSIMNVFTGLEMISDKQDPRTGPNAHLAGMTHALTGAFRAFDPGRSDGLSGVIGGVSIDRYIFENLPTSPGGHMLALVNGGSDHGGTLLPQYSPTTAGGPDFAPQQYLGHANLLYDRYFRPFFNPGDGGEVERANRRRTAITNLIRGEGNRLVSGLGRDQARKLQEHLDTLSTIRARLNLTVSGTVPGESLIDRWGEYATNPPDEASIANNWDLTSSLHPQMVAAALHAGITRVATIHVSTPANDLFDYTSGTFNENYELIAPGDFDTSDWHDLHHKVAAQPGEAFAVDFQAAEAQRIRDNERTGAQTIEAMELVRMRAFLNFLGELESRTEPDGSTLLDNTLVVYCSEIGDGSHALWRLPWAVFGSGQGYFRTGRCINLPRRENGGRVVPFEEWSQWHQDGRPHNDLFVSLANAMGIDTQVFGEPSVCTGPITELR